MNKHKIYVYGTLMPNDGREKVLIPGLLYDLGWFPGIKFLDHDAVNPVVVCEIIEVDNNRLKELDRYEGYHPDDEVNSLYIRRSYRDGWIYEYNNPCCTRDLIPSGDWLAHKSAKQVNSNKYLSEVVA